MSPHAVRGKQPSDRSGGRRATGVRRRLRLLFAGVVSLLMVWSGISGASVAQAADITAVGSLTKTANETTLKPGEEVTYSLLVGCTSDTTNCHKAVLIDEVPSPLEVTKVEVVGAASSAYEISRTGNTVRVDFKQKHKVDGETGLGDGNAGNLEVLITAKLPSTTPPTRDGDVLRNSASLSGENLVTKEDSVPVTLDVPPTVDTTLAKAWQNTSIVEGGTNRLTLSNIANASNIPATSLTVVDPLDPSAPGNPFDKVAFTGFGSVAFPAGADQVQVDAYVDGAWVTGIAAATAALPGSVDAAEVKGLRITFSHSTGEDLLTAGGSAGSVQVNTTSRAGATGAVSNTAQVTVKTPKGDDTATSSHDFTITAPSYKVSAAKVFVPASIVAGGSSTATLTGRNTSDRNLTSITLTDPNEKSPFTALTFTGFAETAWPAGATGGTVTINGGAPQTITNGGDGNVVWPAVAVPVDVTSIAVTYTGDFAPNAEVTAKFTVTNRGAITEVTRVDNDLRVTGTAANPDQAVTPATAEARLTIDPVKQQINPSKSVTPAVIAGKSAEQVTSNLTAQVDGNNTNTFPTQLVLTDTFDANWQEYFAATSITVNPTATGETAKVEYFNGTSWVLVEEDITTSETVALPAGAQGVRVTYDLAGDATYAAWASRSATLVSTVSKAIPTGTALKDTLLANTNPTGSTAGTTASTELSLDVWKSWSPNSVEITPENGQPTSKLTYGVRNTSAVATSMSIVDPTGATKPFEYVDVTKVTVGHEGVAAGDVTTVVTATPQDGPTFDPTDAANAEKLKDIVKLELTVTMKDGAALPHLAAATLTVDTKLRTHTRTDSRPISEALAADDANAEQSGWQIANIMTGTVDDGPGGLDPKSLDASAPRTVTDVTALVAKAVKTITPAATTMFAADGVDGRKPVTVQLGVEHSGRSANTVVLEDVDPTFWNAFDFHTFTRLAAASSGSDLQVTTQFLTGAEFAVAGTDVTVTGGTWTTVEDVRIPSGSNAPNATLRGQLLGGVQPGDIQGIRITYTRTGGGVIGTVGGQSSLSFEALPRPVLRSGAANQAGLATGTNPGEETAYTVVNTLTGWTAYNDKESEKSTADAPVTFTGGTPAVKADKTNGSGSDQITVPPGTEVSFLLKFTNTGTAAITNPVLTDSLPTDAEGALLVYLPWETPVYTVSPSTALITTNDSEITLTPGDYDTNTADGPNPTTLTFTFPEGTVLMPGETFTVELKLQVRPAVNAGSEFTNEITVTADEEVTSSDDTTVKVQDGMGVTRNKFVRETVGGDGKTPQGENPVDSRVDEVNAERSCLPYEDGFYRYPCVVETNPGGTATWLFEVRNTGNQPLTTMQAIDVLPFAGNTGTVTNLGLGSKWDPVFQGNLTVDTDLPQDADVTIEYYIGDGTACKPTDGSGKPVLAGGKVACSAADDGTQWVDVEPTDLSSVSAIRVTVKSETGISPRHTFRVTFDTLAPEYMPDGVDDLSPTWNSVGVYAESTQGKTVWESPNKAGITFRNDYAVGDYVWIDDNGNGRQDAGEDPLPGVKVTLWQKDGEGSPVQVGETTTDPDGFYLFDRLPAGTYWVQFELTEDQAAEYQFTRVGAGDDRGDSDAVPDEENPAIGVTEEFELGPENTSLTLDYDGIRANRGIDPTWDAGVVKRLVSIGDYVWYDDDRDGIQDDDELPYPGMRVELLDADGELVKDTETDENGYYFFNNLQPDTDYQVKFIPLPHEGFTQQTEGEDQKVDSNPDVETGIATVRTPKSGRNLTGPDLTDDPTIDAGVITKRVSVGDLVWVDNDRDGRQDEGEPGIPDVYLILEGPDGEPVTDIFGNPVGPVKTDADGKYLFENLPALSGDQVYTVRIDRERSAEALKPYVPTIAEQGDREGDSSTWQSSTRAGDLQRNGQSDPTLDFGFVLKTYAIGDVVWIDANSDGIQDAGEKPLAGVSVELRDADGKVIAITTTDAQGRYLFDDLLAGRYQVRFVLTDEQQAKYGFTRQNAGGGEVDSDADPVTGYTAWIVLDDANGWLTTEYSYADVHASQGIDPTWDAGVVLLPVAPDDDEEGDDDEDDLLPITGAGGGLWLLGIAGLALVAGGLGLRSLRRRPLEQ